MVEVDWPYAALLCTHATEEVESRVQEVCSPVAPLLWRMHWGLCPDNGLFHGLIDGDLFLLPFLSAASAPADWEL